MRHGNKINKLSRKTGHRAALLRSLACQLIKHKRIVTSVAKAKALRVYVEPLITKAKENTTHQRRLVFSYLNDKVAVDELFSVVSPKVGERPGGYTRIIKLGSRLGDNTELAMIELVDFNEIYGRGKSDGDANKKKTRRGGRRRSSGAAKSNEEPTTSEAVVKEAEKEIKADVATAEATTEKAAEEVTAKVEEVKEEVKAETEKAPEAEKKADTEAKADDAKPADEAPKEEA